MSPVELRYCVEPGCDAVMSPIIGSQMVLKDQDENEVYMRRWTCFKGHWFTLEDE